MLTRPPGSGNLEQYENGFNNSGIARNSRSSVYQKVHCTLRLLAPIEFAEALGHWNQRQTAGFGLIRKG